MAGRITFGMIKPSAVNKRHTGPILARIAEAGFRLVSLRMTRLSPTQARKFYEVHAGKHFFDDLIAFMTEGPVVTFILEKENAVEEFRTLIGATNPEKAAEGTIRKMFGTSLQRNAIHGSDSDENAIIESAFFFSAQERYAENGKIF